VSSGLGGVSLGAALTQRHEQHLVAKTRSAEKEAKAKQSKLGKVRATLSSRQLRLGGKSDSGSFGDGGGVAAEDAISNINANVTSKLRILVDKRTNPGNAKLGAAAGKFMHGVSLKRQHEAKMSGYRAEGAAQREAAKADKDRKAVTQLRQASMADKHKYTPKSKTVGGGQTEAQKMAEATSTLVKMGLSGQPF
jgi:hypothetical protein